MATPDLSRFRADGSTQEDRETRPERDRSIAPNRSARILAFDQSIRKVGWSISLCSPGAFIVESTGMIRTNKVRTSHDDTLTSGEAIFDEVREIIAKTSPTAICHETPIVGGGRFIRPDAALVSGMAIRSAARIAGVPVSMWGSKTVKLRLTGDPNASKEEVRASIDLLLPGVAGLRPRNEDTYDSIGLAIVEAEEGAHHG